MSSDAGFSRSELVPSKNEALIEQRQAIVEYGHACF